jgi:hypothetical protein
MGFHQLGHSCYYERYLDLESVDLVFAVERNATSATNNYCPDNNNSESGERLVERVAFLFVAMPSNPFLSQNPFVLLHYLSLVRCNNSVV